MSDTTENTPSFSTDEPTNENISMEEGSGENQEGDEAGEQQFDEDGNPILEIPEEDDTEEIDYEGKKLKVPKEIKDAILRHADYTRKTQEVAEERRQVEAMRAQAKENAALQQEVLVEVAKVVSIDQRLAQYSNIDWNRFYDEDPVGASKADRESRELQAHKAHILNEITQKEQAQNLKREQATAKAYQENMAVLERDIKGWSPKLQQELKAYALETGLTQEEVASIQSAAQVKALHRAYLYDQLVKKQAAQKSKPASQAAPVTRISAQKAGTNKDPDKMTSAEWLKWRNSQVTRKK